MSAIHLIGCAFVGVLVIFVLTLAIRRGLEQADDLFEAIAPTREDLND